MEDIKKFWPGWEVLGVLGQGGFGKVYKAKRESFGNITYSAIKVIQIPNDLSEIKEMKISGFSDEHITSYYKESVQSLINEISLMENLKSAGNIVGIEDYYVLENDSGFGWKIYIRMELLTNLYDYMDNKDFHKKSIVKMGIDICNALEYCHSLNIIHRDIKPDNIFVTKFNDFKLGDFGVSREVEKMNATMSQKGTKSYMAPEMIRLSKYDHTVDFYALGLSMYELLNHGRMPFLPKYPEVFFSNDKEDAMLKRLTGVEFPDIEGIGHLNIIIKKACHYDPKMRYQSASEMKQDLLQFDTSILDSKDFLEKKDNNLSDKTIKSGALTRGTNNTGKDDSLTVVISGNGLFDHLDIKKDKIEPESMSDAEYFITKKNKKAYLVFNHGYYDGNKLILTKENETTKQLMILFSKLETASNRKQVLKKMIDLDNCAQLYYQLGIEYMKKYSKKYSKDAFKKAYELDPNDGTICKALALTYFEEKKYEEAYKIINQSIKQCLSNKYSRVDTLFYAYGVKSIICQSLSKYNEALASLLKAYQLSGIDSFDIHCYPLTSSTQASVLHFLYGLDDRGYSRTENLMELSSVFDIGSKVYNDEINKVYRKYNRNIPKLINSHTTLLNLDKLFYREITFTKIYYYGYRAFYNLNNISNYSIPYFSYAELIDCNVTKLNNKELVFKKKNNQFSVRVGQSDIDLFLDVYRSIIKKNKKLLGKEENNGTN